jgi:hypothetical protein
VGGAVAGTVAAFITTPFDVIKTARQTDLSAGTVHFLTKLNPNFDMLGAISRPFCVLFWVLGKAK